jgi:hypothetical protein
MRDCAERFGRRAFCCMVAIAFAPAPLLGTSLAAKPDKSLETASFHPLLDGLVFVVDYGPLGKKSLGQDVLIFEDGLFASRGCQAMGFGAAPYWLRVEDDTIQFRAEMSSAEHGILAFTGRIAGEQIEVTSLWTRQRWYRTVVLESWYRGSTAEPGQPLPTKP